MRINEAGSTLIGLYPSCPAPTFVVVSGLLSELYADAGFDRANCLGSFSGEASDNRADPAAADGFYYLSKSLNGACDSRGYGAAGGIAPDPRDALLALDPCP